MSDERHGIEIEIDSRPASAGEQRVVRSLENIKRKAAEAGRTGQQGSDQAASGFARWSRAVDKVVAAGQKLPNLRTHMRAAGDAARDAGQKAYDAWNRATTKMDAFGRAVDQVTGKLSRFSNDLNRGPRDPFGHATSSANRFNSALGQVHSTILALGLGAMARDIAQTNVRFMGFTQALRIVTGSSQEASRELAFAAQLSERLGFRVQDLTAAYVQFAAASRGTRLEGEQQRYIFEQITRAAAAYGLSNEQLRGSLLAVQQMISKGQVQAEELRGQLGERLPGAVQIAARALGTTTQNLSKMLEAGGVLSEEFLPRFAAQLDRELPDGVRSANAAFNQFLSELDRAKIAIAEGGFFEGLSRGAAQLGDVLQQMANDGSLERIGFLLGTVVKFLAENLDTIILLGTAYVGLKAAMLALNVVMGASQLIIRGWTALAAAATAATAAFTGASGAAAGALAVLRTAFAAMGPVGWLTLALGAAAAALLYFNSSGQQTVSTIDQLTTGTGEAGNLLRQYWTEAQDASAMNQLLGETATQAADGMRAGSAEASEFAQWLREVGAQAQWAALQLAVVGQAQALLRFGMAQTELARARALPTSGLSGADRAAYNLGDAPERAQREAAQAQSELGMWTQTLGRAMQGFGSAAQPDAPASPIHPVGRHGNRRGSRESPEERRERLEQNFFQDLENQVRQAGMLKREAESYNAELELRRILNDGNAEGEREITEQQRLQIQNLIEQRRVNEFLTGLREARMDAEHEAIRLEERQRIIASTTYDEQEDALELHDRMWDHRLEAMRQGIDLEDQTVQAQLTEIENLERQNIALERKNRLIQQGVDIAREYRTPAMIMEDEVLENGRRRQAVTEAYASGAISQERFERAIQGLDQALWESTNRFRLEFIDSIEFLAQQFSGKLGRAIQGIAHILQVIAAQAKGDFSQSGIVGGIIGLFGGPNGNPVADAARAASQNTLEQLFSGQTWGNPFKSMSDSFKGFSNNLGAIFGRGGSFTQGLGAILGQAGMGAAIGSATNSIFKALGIKSSNMGAQLGGAAGQALFGPIGGILGSIGGGLLGGLLKKTKTGSATIAGDSISGTGGNNRAFREAATGAAKTVIQGLNQIADMLGGNVGAFGAITIGQRKDSWRVNAGGSSLKTSKGAKDFGEDQAAAIAYAVQLAVQRGAITGLSQATSRVLKSVTEDTLDSVVNAAKTYEDLLRQAKLLADPINGAFDALNTGIEQTIVQLQKAGYTNAEIAQLQGVFAAQQKDLLEEMTQGYKDFLDEITKGPESGKTVFAQFQDALSAFRTLRDSGTATQEQFTEKGQSVFALARQVYGTATPEFEAIKAELVAATQDALADVESAAAASRDASAVIDAINAAAGGATGQRDETNSLLEQILANLNGGTASSGAGSATAAGGGGGGGRLERTNRQRF